MTSTDADQRPAVRDPRPTYRASWHGIVIAESADVWIVEGNVYFPPDSLRGEYLIMSRYRSLCLWKGVASYHHLTDGEQVERNAAWYYPHPSPLARRIKDHVAFWGSVKVAS